MKSGIYLIINTINKKQYVGSALNLNKRISNHKSDLKRNKHSNKILQSSWNKHTEWSFEFIVLEYCEKEKLIEREQYYIDEYDCVAPKDYNLNPKAGSNLGKIWSTEARQNMRQARLSLPAEFLSALGKMTKGRKHTVERKEAISAFHKGNKWASGTKQSKETIAKKIHSRKANLINNSLMINY